MQKKMSHRDQIAHASRIVVKVGSSSLTRPDGNLDVSQIASITRVLAAAHNRGQQVVLVSSGSTAAGIGPLGLSGKPHEMHLHQAAAMVGQSRLLAAWEAEFAKAGITIGQVLFTAEDVINRRHYANAQSALTTLLSLGVIPIVNENDAVVTDELRFGDNDRLAALTSHLVASEALILLTDVDGLYTMPPKFEGARLISEVRSMRELADLEITGRGSNLGTGGMRTKVDAADLACSGGVATLVTSPDYLGPALAGETVGTWFHPTGQRTSARKLWLEHAAQVKGIILVDDGAAAALRRGGTSLLPVGVFAVAGRFASGDLVEIRQMGGTRIGRGVCGFSSEELTRIAGDKDAAHGLRPVVHVNDFVRARDEELTA